MVRTKSLFVPSSTRQYRALVFGVIACFCVLYALSGNQQSLALGNANDASHRVLAEKVHTEWLRGESLEFRRIDDYNASFVFVADAPDKGIDAIESFLLRAESHVRSLFHHLLFMPGCESREEQERWGIGCVVQSSGSKERLFLDVGSNRGYYTLMSASYGHRVISFDPQPHCVQMLNAEVLLGGFSDRVIVKNAFVGAKNETRTVTRRTGCMGGFPGNEGPWADRHRKAHEKFDGAQDKISVTTKSLDEMFSRETHDILLLKIDTEGSEIDVFASAWKLLKGRAIRNIIVEFNSPKMAQRPEGLAAARLSALKIVKELASLGYSSKGSHRGSYMSQTEMTLTDWDRLLHPSSTFVTVDAWFFLK